MPIYNFSSTDDEMFKEGVIRDTGNKIREIRKQRRKTQEEIAEAANINPKYLGEIERGEKSPSAVVICRLAQALNAPVCEILGSNYCLLKRKQLADEVAGLLQGGGD